MDRVYICSPYGEEPKKDLEATIEHCKLAYEFSKLPIAPTVYFTGIYPANDWHNPFLRKIWGKELMGDCKQIWIFCNELTEEMTQEISEAKKLGLKMKFYNVIQEEINNDNYLLHTELGPAYRRIIAQSYGDRICIEGSTGECNICRKGSGDHTETRKNRELPECKVQYEEKGRSGRSGVFFNGFLRRK